MRTPCSSHAAGQSGSGTQRLRPIASYAHGPGSSTSSSGARIGCALGSSGSPIAREMAVQLLLAERRDPKVRLT